MKREINDARPASAVSNPSASIKWPKLIHNPSSIPAFLVWTSFLASKTNGKKGMADTINLTAENAAGSIKVSASFTTRILLAAVENKKVKVNLNNH